MAAPPKKQYGLILKKKPTVAPSASVGASKLSFAFNDDSDEDNPTTSIESKSKLSVTETRIKKQARAQHEKALAEDPTVFDYDAAYDDMQLKKKQIERQQKEADKDKKPKYITQLLKSAKTRELETQAREERKQQKERQEEGEQFADKETFVTGAYRKQMEEVQKYREEEAHREALEARMNVKNQKDLSGFYRHFLNDVMARDGGAAVESNVKQESPDDQAATGPKLEPSTGSKSSPKIEKKTKPESKSYRTRRESTSSSGSEEEESSSEDEGTKNKKRTIYSSDESEPENAPQSKEKQADLQALFQALAASQLQRRISTETKIQEQRRRFFTPSPEPEDKQNGAVDDGEQVGKFVEPKLEPGKKSSKSDKSSKFEKARRKRHDSSSSTDSDSKFKSAKKSKREEKADVKPDIKDIKPPPDPKLERLRKLREIFARRNDRDSIDEYRRRYFERKAAGEVIPAM